VPLTVDGLIYASSMVMPDSARRRLWGLLCPSTKAYQLCMLAMSL
jgi:hypothetical protein